MDSDRDESEKQIGPYRILSLLGEGGMGTVYVAEQKEPVRRRVALKLIKLGMDSKQVLARFEAERQALAMMEHGNIARVFDCGLSDRGQPYFAMEFVKGRPITKYCDDNKLSIQDRLELFIQVCDGVQHAHNKGIIHRDLTPNNILVSVQDGERKVKIIDFGLARATDHRLTEATIFTEQGQIIGTPEYMSPEQAGLSDLDVDTRTDVYTLGVVLYELLTSEVPFGGAELRRAGLMEIQRIIREEDPHKPSTRVTTRSNSGSDAADVAARRGTDLRALARHLRGDLDWIVMRALEKEPVRRYDTASELAADVRRHLRDEPVDASPPSTIYRFGKIVRRHRMQVVAGVFLFVSMSAGITGTTWFMLEAQGERNTAREQESIAKQETARAEREKKEAQRQEGLARSERDGKDRALRRARASGLAMVSVLEARQNPILSLLLAREATKIDNSPAAIQRLRDAIAGCPVRKVLPHREPVSSALFSPSGDRIVTASWDRTARIFDLSGNELAACRGHQGILHSAVFSPSGDRVLTASYDKTARLWDLSGRELAVLRGHRDQVVSAVFSPAGDRILTASYDGTARLWDSRGKVVSVFRGHEDFLYGAEFSPSGKLILTASHDKTARLWDASGKELRPYPNPGPVRSARFSRSEKMVLTASDSYMLWDLNPTQPQGVNDWRGQSIGASPMFSPTEDRILSIRGVSAWIHGFSGETVRELVGHQGPVISAKYSNSGQRILTASLDGSVRVWDARGKETAVLPGHERKLHSAVFSPFGDHVLTASLDPSAPENEVCLWAIPYGEVAMFRHMTESRCDFFSPSGDHILTIPPGKNTARLWSARGVLLATLHGHTGRLSSARFSPSGDRILTLSEDKTARIWDLDGETVAVMRIEVDSRMDSLRLDSVDFSPSGDRIIWRSVSKRAARIFDLTGKTVATLDYPGVSISRDHILAWPYASGEAHLHDLDGKRTATLRIGGTRFNSLDFSSAGDRILTSSRNQLDNMTARIWDLEGKAVTVLRGSTSPFKYVEFSPTGDRILTVSSDKKVRVWNNDGRELVELPRRESRLKYASLSSSGDLVLTCSEAENKEKTARVWDMSGKEIAVLPMGGQDSDLGHNIFVSGKHIVARLLSADRMQTTRIWNLSGDELAVLRGRHPVVVFSPTGDQILTGSHPEHSARLLDESGKEVAVFRSTDSRLRHMTFSPSGETVLTVSADDTVRLWLVHEKDVLELADQRITRDFTPGELNRFADLLDVPRKSPR